MAKPPFTMSKYARREDLLADANCYYENLLREVALFLDDLPQDLGRGSLNGFKVQLQQKIADTVPNAQGEPRS